MTAESATRRTADQEREAGIRADLADLPDSENARNLSSFFLLRLLDAEDRNSGYPPYWN